MSIEETSMPTGSNRVICTSCNCSKPFDEEICHICGFSLSLGDVTEGTGFFGSWKSAAAAAFFWLFWFVATLVDIHRGYAPRWFEYLNVASFLFAIAWLVFAIKRKKKAR
jgi:hypothetical protein